MYQPLTVTKEDILHPSVVDNKSMQQKKINECYYVTLNIYKLLRIPGDTIPINDNTNNDKKSNS